jgi:hypothetical protein
MSQSESERRAEEAKARAKDRELTDAELETIAAAGGDPIKGSGSGGSSQKKH